MLVALATLTLPLLLGAHRERLLNLSRTTGGRRRGIRRLLFKFLDPLLGRFKFLPGRFELPLQHPNDVDQPIKTDSPLANVLLELLDGVHTAKLRNRTARSCAK